MRSSLRVEFSKLDNHGRGACRWDAVRSPRTRIPGTTMALTKDIPHDVAQYVIEAATAYPDGFWGLLSLGATFKSTGRKRTKPGRAVIAAHRPQLARAEELAGLHMALWRARRPGPVTDALDQAAAQWQALAGAERLVFDWPSAGGRIERPVHPVPTAAP
jgi:hypothetical protein